MKKRTNISFTEVELGMLRRYREETGVGVSELMRRLVDEFFADKPQFWASFVLPVPGELAEQMERATKEATFKVNPADLRLG